MNNAIIISADDFGISHLASENILRLVELGKLDRVEVMMSKNILPSQVKRLLDSGVALDIHLHLAKNELDFWQEHTRKIDDGAIIRGIKFISRYAIGITGVKSIKKEWESQIEDFITTFGKTPDGASSHEHIHFFPPYFNCIMQLCNKFNITHLRFGKNNSINCSGIAKILNWLRGKNLENFHKSGLSSTDFMISFDWINDLNPILKQHTPNTVKEIVFHPEKSAEFDILAKFNKLN